MSEQPFPAGCRCVLTWIPKTVTRAKLGDVVTVYENTHVMHTDGALTQYTSGGFFWWVKYMRRIDDDPTDEELRDTLGKVEGEDVPLLTEVVV